MDKVITQVRRKARKGAMATCLNEKCGHRWFILKDRVPRQCPKCWSDRVAVEKTA